MASNGNGVAKESKEARSLFERIEFPSIPKEAGRKIAQLEQEFIRAEVEQRKWFLLFFCRDVLFFVSSLSVVVCYRDSFSCDRDRGRKKLSQCVSRRGEKDSNIIIDLSSILYNDYIEYALAIYGCLAM